MTKSDQVLKILEEATEEIIALTGAKWKQGRHDDFLTYIDDKKTEFIVTVYQIEADY